MTRSIVWFLLALSVLFNVFFVFGYMQAKANSQLQDGNFAEATRVTDFVGNELQLNDKQRAVFSKLRKEMRVFEESSALADQELLYELARNNPNLDKVRDMVANQSDLNNQRRYAGSQRFNDFLKTLSPDQCKRLSDRVGRSRQGRDRFQRMLNRFDENKNGKLDADEMEKAKAEHRARRDKWQKEMLARYDANGDGKLDDEEKRAMRENGSRQRRNRLKEGSSRKDN